MAKIKLDGLSKHLKESITRALEETITPQLMQQVGDDFVDQIRTRTRLGNGLDKHKGEPSKLRPLSKDYVESRKTFKKLSPLTKPGKSNLTLTGEMLDQLKATVQGAKITITFGNQFSKDKARWNQESGRKFLFISRVQIERLKNGLEKKITTLLKKYL
jgi:hypothetical protein